MAKFVKPDLGGIASATEKVATAIEGEDLNIALQALEAVTQMARKQLNSVRATEMQASGIVGG
jgi:hypothetical protein